MAARTPQARADRRAPAPILTHHWQALATCAHCPWSATMTGDVEAEVETFLRALLIEHITTLHPRPPDGQESIEGILSGGPA